MKVLVVGSKSVHVSSFLLAMKGEGHEIYFLAEEECGYEGVKEEQVISFRSMNPMNVMKSNRRLKELLKTLKPDVVHIHQVNRLAYFVSRLTNRMNIPVVTTAWGSDVLLIPQQSKFYRFLVTKVLERSNSVTADSMEMIDAMKKMAASANYVLLQYGIDKITATTKEKVIYSNRLHKPLYRIDAIIGYFASFSAEFPEWKLVVGAVGEQTETLKKQVKELKLDNQVSFVGWLEKEQNNSWYAKASIYVSIPESDGTSVSVLEAMSAGCIPVVADLPVSHEWIQSGDNGIIEQEGQNPLMEALKIDRETCAKKNEKMIDERATRKVSVKRFNELYNAANSK